TPPHNNFSANGDNPLNFVSHDRGSLQCATRLRYAPTSSALLILKHFWTHRTPRRDKTLPKTGPNMNAKQSIQLGQVEETLLVPLYARALESRRKRPIVDDPNAIEMVDSIDWDFQRFGQRWRVFSCALRDAMFDVWTADFIRSHPAGTVVEIGAGLNTRFERLDNGRVHWFDLDLPDAVELRRKFFADTGRRTILAGSVLDSNWIDMVQQSPGPYFLVAETVFVYLEQPHVKAALSQIMRSFPSACVAFDTVSRKAIDNGNKDFVRRNMAVRFAWACDDPREIERWNIGLRLVESRTLVDVPDPLKPRLSVPMRITFGVFRRLFPKLAQAYQLNLFAGQPGA
ncbi:MAG: class I SAM-dependent methyltransferase, partial [Bryobacteraceae bacterium]